MIEHKRGGRREGAGRPSLALIDRKVKKSVTLDLTAIEAINERKWLNEDFSTALNRILNDLPVLPPAQE